MQKIEGKRPEDVTEAEALAAGVKAHTIRISPCKMYPNGAERVAFFGENPHVGHKTAQKAYADWIHSRGGRPRKRQQGNADAP